SVSGSLRKSGTRALPTTPVAPVIKTDRFIRSVERSHDLATSTALGEVAVRQFLHPSVQWLLCGGALSIRVATSCWASCGPLQPKIPQASPGSPVRAPRLPKVDTPPRQRPQVFRRMRRSPSGAQTLGVSTPSNRALEPQSQQAPYGRYR